MNWLAQLSDAPEKTAEQVLAEAIDTFSASELHSLLTDLEPSWRPSQVGELQTKVAHHEQLGRDLAREQMSKEALLGAALTAGRALLGGGGLGAAAKSVGKDMAMGAIGNKITGALKPAGQPAASAAMGGSSMGGGGFKYAGLLAGAGRQVAGFMHRNPGAAMTLGGAAVGAVTAPRDPQTGEKQMLRGALMGGGLAAGANAVSKGQLADKMKTMVTRQNNPILGQGARRYMTESALMTREGGGGAAAALARQAPAPGAAPAPGTRAPVTAPTSPAANDWATAHANMQAQIAAQHGPKGPMPEMFTNYAGGPTTGTVKVASLGDFIKAAAQHKQANRSSLVYDPATKTFTRQHQTMSSGQGAMPDIQAGSTAPLMGHNGLPSQTAARPAAVPPPVPAAAKRPVGGLAGLAGSAAKPKAMPGIGAALAKIANKKR